ncbi:hypothetical protein DFA_12275 [Cavenderia fasciculata]|uniref:Uncharacterized protein n=1 Tax=Cavenderia fasciculata TaxID=261658 RepID=F4QCX6_CACFS|nr:uncharacterized protein DFA_12275 [Cavenderia fasciculata]EGG14500.1 hypothetical protein DFA_12275 [Cavenderia fasciculata]|eukprot:XP_004353909.1 hypothetical protein DFA_12275 [Cavenderia fasciculata]
MNQLPLYIQSIILFKFNPHFGLNDTRTKVQLSHEDTYCISASRTLSRSSVAPLFLVSKHWFSVLSTMASRTVSLITIGGMNSHLSSPHSFLSLESIQTLQITNNNIDETNIESVLKLLNHMTSLVCIQFSNASQSYDIKAIISLLKQGGINKKIKFKGLIWLYQQEIDQFNHNYDKDELEIVELLFHHSFDDQRYFQIVENVRPTTVNCYTSGNACMSYDRLFRIDSITDLDVTSTPVPFKFINVALQSKSLLSLRLKAPVHTWFQESAPTVSIDCNLTMQQYSVARSRHGTSDYGFVKTIDTETVNPSLIEFSRLLHTNQTLTRLEFKSYCTRDHTSSSSGGSGSDESRYSPNKILTDCFATLFENNQTLKHLSLAEVDYLDQRFFSSLATCKSLQSLAILFSDSTHQFKKQSVEWISQSLPFNKSLILLDLHLSNSTTDTNLLESLTNIPNRNYLVIFNLYISPQKDQV